MGSVVSLAIPASQISTHDLGEMRLNHWTEILEKKERKKERKKESVDHRKEVEADTERFRSRE